MTVVGDGIAPNGIITGDRQSNASIGGGNQPDTTPSVIGDGIVQNSVIIAGEI
jgi:hypothetical protein